MFPDPGANILATGNCLLLLFVRFIIGGSKILIGSEIILTAAVLFYGLPDTAIKMIAFDVYEVIS